VQTFKDWALRCPPATECVLEQRVLLKDNEATPLLHLAFQYGGQPRALTAILRIPLGVLLAPGVTLTIDARAPVPIPFNHCRPEGCLALAPVSDRLLAALRRGKTAQVSYRLDDGRGLAVPLSLSGLNAGLRVLGKRPEQ
jgi:invasion protein IalB